MTDKGSASSNRQLSLGLFDHVGFALGGMGLQLLLARQLGIREYGLFSSLFSYLVLAGLAQAALFIEPMLVETQGRYRDENKLIYLRYLFRVQCMGAGVVGLLALCVAAVLWKCNAGEVASATAAFGLVIPGVLSMWFLRKACYAILATGRAVEGAAVYLLSLGLGALLINEMATFTVVSSILLLGLAAGAASLWLMGRIRLQRLTSLQSSTLDGSFLSQLKRFHPLLLSGILGWIPSQGIYAILPLSLADGFSHSGELKASMNFLLPAQHVAAAGVSVLTPLLSSRLAGGRPAPRGRLFGTTVVLGLGYWALLAALAPWGVEIAYGRGDAKLVELVRVAGGLAPLWAVRTWTRSEVLARRAPSIDAWSSLASCVAFALIGMPLLMQWGALGGAYALLLTLASAIVVQLAYLLRHVNPPPAEAPP